MEKLSREDAARMKERIDQLAGNQARIMLAALLMGEPWEHSLDYALSYPPRD